MKWRTVVYWRTISAAVLGVGLLLAALLSFRPIRSSSGMSRLVEQQLYEAAPALEMPQPRSIPAAPPANLDPEDLKQHFGPLFAEYMSTHHIPGAIFTVVKDGKVLYSHGYGFANLEKRIPVDPDRTLFRVASISKTFMATAAMQLWEQGRLDLNADVNQYLPDWKLKTPYPVTMAELLTHTAGFDEQVIGMASRTQETQPPLGDYLRRRMPPQAIPPNDVISYSNHGSALAGYVIQEISGEPFAEYAERHILQPLGMNHSSFLLPDRLRPDIATGYDYDSQTKSYHPLEFDYLNIAPAGALNATGSDMARYMIAHLQDGRYGDVRILKAETAREMHRQHFTHHPRLAGFSYGFYGRIQNGQRSIEHNGLWVGFGSSMFLLPAKHVGLFVSCNATESRLGELIVWSFLNRYFPENPGDRKDASLALVTNRSHTPVRGKAPTTNGQPLASDAAGVAGSYRFNRYDRHSFCKLFALYSEFDVRCIDDSMIEVTAPSGIQTRWREVEPLLFQLEGGEQLIAFRKSESGAITHLFLGTAACDRLPWYETGYFQTGLIQFLILLHTLVLCIWLVSWLAGRAAPEPAPVTPRWLGLAAGAGLAFAIFWILFPVALFGSGFEICYGVPSGIRLMLYLPLVYLALTGGAYGNFLRSFDRSYNGHRLRAVGAVVFTLFTAASIGSLIYWNMLG